MGKRKRASIDSSYMVRLLFRKRYYDAKAFKCFDAIFFVIRGATSEPPRGNRLSFLVRRTLVLKRCLS